MNNVSALGKETFCCPGSGQAPAGCLPRAGAPNPSGSRALVIWQEDPRGGGGAGRGLEGRRGRQFQMSRRVGRMVPGVSREPERTRAGGRGWVGGGVSRPVTCLRRVSAPRVGEEVPSRVRTPCGATQGATAWAVVEQGGRGPLRSPWQCSPNPNPAVDRLLVKWSLASSAPKRVEVSMMKKFCDTGVRKRLANTAGEAV